MSATHLSNYVLIVAKRQSNPMSNDADSTLVELIDLSTRKVLWRGTVSRLDQIMRGDKKIWTQADLQSVRDMIVDRRIKGVYVNGNSILRRAQNPKAKTAADVIHMPGVGYEAIDMMMDLTNDPVFERSIKRREVQMDAAHAKGLGACEVCGKALDPKTSILVVDDTGTKISQLGPECARKMRKLLTENNPTRTSALADRLAQGGG